MLDQSLDRVFQALADPSRRAMVERLCEGPASVSELARPFSMTLAAVVQHVQVLEASGLVRSEKVGRTRTVSIEPPTLRTAEQWISEQRTHLGAPPRPVGHIPRTAKERRMSVEHSTFVLERTYDAAPDRVFAAWADPEAKAQWFGGDGFALDFRVGGRETNGGGPEGGPLTATRRSTATSCRTSGSSTRPRCTPTTGCCPSRSPRSSSRPTGDGTRLTLTEHGAFLDGQETPAQREQGTGELLDRLGAALAPARA